MTQLLVHRCGPMVTLQDAGRRGVRHLGMPRAGALRPDWRRLALALAGADPEAPVLELFDSAIELAAQDGDVTLAWAGPVEPRLHGEAGIAPRRLSGWRSVTLRPGQRLVIGVPTPGRLACVAVAGVDVPSMLGSRSTYTRAAFGGHEGRPLRGGDRLVLTEVDTPPGARWLPDPPSDGAGPIRLVPGPQDDHFEAAVHALLVSTQWEVTREADRMGIRLAGPRLVHDALRGAEIVTDATVPGSIQVPGHGQPIVLLADGQTAGGYPKIATVASAELPRLASMPVGARLRFEAIDVAQAAALARTAEDRLQRALARIAPLAEPDAMDSAALLAHNLISGMIDADAPDGACP